MSYIKKIDKGASTSYSMSFGGMVADVDKELANKTLKEIADILATQGKIKNGEIEIFSLNFNIKKANKEDKILNGGIENGTL